MADDAEAEAKARLTARARIRLTEPLEDIRKKGGRDPDTRVTH